MKETEYTVISNTPLNASVYEMRLAGDNSAITRPGQFVNLKVTGKFLRRPISVCDVEGDALVIVYKVVGEGTAIMSRYTRGEKVNALTGLGNGFDIDRAQGKVALIGGGVGLPPLYWLLKTLLSRGVKPTVLAGFRTAADEYYIDRFSRLADVKTATEDGSLGVKGRVTDLFKAGEYDYFFACGPEPMLAALVNTGMDGQLSYEARMGCGFGACMGCSCKTKEGAKRICADGPVMTAEEMRL